MKLKSLATGAAVFLVSVHAFALDPSFPSTNDKVPVGWTGPVFSLSQNYPKTLPPDESLPWANIDFAKQPDNYVQALYQYVLQGNVEANWVVQKNQVRKWYHAPWMHYGDSGREFVHGMTRERTTPAPSSAGKGGTRTGPSSLRAELGSRFL